MPEKIDISTRQAYDAIARAYLTRLAEHGFPSWPAGIREALLPVAMPDQPIAVSDRSLAPSPAPVTLKMPCPPVATGPKHSLPDAFAA